MIEKLIIKKKYKVLIETKILIIIKLESINSIKLISPTNYNIFKNGTKYLNNKTGLEVTKAKEYIFNFDYVFDKYSRQNEVYDYSTSFLINNIFEGYNATLISYGSTGSGKTYTMFGTLEQPGIILRAINQILNKMEKNQIDLYFDLQISIYEVYNESIYDLISDENNNKKKQLAEIGHKINLDEDLINFNNKSNAIYNNYFLMGITKKIIENQEDAIEYLSEASKNRSKTLSPQNYYSSLSHIIIQLNIVNKNTNVNNSLNMSEKSLIKDKENTKFGKLLLVDLAGIEKTSDIKPNSDNFYINKSLFTLTNCINGLIHNKSNSFIPWRDSKLTRILKSSLSGNSKVAIIASISPSLLTIDDTMSTLNFTKKARQVKTYVQKNMGNIGIHIKKFDSIITRLKSQIELVKNEIKLNDEENSAIQNEEQNKSKTIISSLDDNSREWNEMMKKYFNEINEHFSREIEVNKKINEIDSKIIEVNNNKNINKNNISNKMSKLNDYQVSLNELYKTRFELIKDRKDIQNLISTEMKKNENNGKYLMYVYKFHINYINQLQSINRKNKIVDNMLKKDNQIKELNSQIKLRDNLLKCIKQKIGKKNSEQNSKMISNLEELNLDPCVEKMTIKNEPYLNQFCNDIITTFNKKFFPKTGGKKIRIKKIKQNSISTSRTKDKNQLSNSLPEIRDYQKYGDYMQKANTKSSSARIRIPSGYMMRDNARTNSRLSGLRTKFLAPFKKFYNIYHISHNYHPNKFNAGNYEYNKVNKVDNGSESRNNFSTIKFENIYANKVKTIINKNFLKRYKNSPYSLDNF